MAEQHETDVTPFIERRWFRWTLYMGIWTFLGLLNTSQSVYLRTQMHLPVVVWKLLFIGLADWYAWALVAPVVNTIARRFPLDRRHWIRHGAVHLAASLVCAVLVSWMLYPFMLAFAWDTGPIDFWIRFPQLLVSHLHIFLGVYACIVGVSHALDYYRMYRDRAIETARLESRLAQAKLQALKAQLDPHFLFNTLNAIASLIPCNPGAAETLLARLGDLLRLTLDSRDVQEVSLREELAFIEPYVEIQRLRLGDRLKVSFSIEPAALDAMVPNLLLQPLIENAIRHGIEPRPGPGTVYIRAARTGDMLDLEIRDDGVGLRDGDSPWKPGVGLANSRERLAYLYGGRYQFSAANSPEGGCKISIRIPWHTYEVANDSARQESSL